MDLEEEDPPPDETDGPGPPGDDGPGDDGPPPEPPPPNLIEVGQEVM